MNDDRRDGAVRQHGRVYSERQTVFLKEEDNKHKLRFDLVLHQNPIFPSENDKQTNKLNKEQHLNYIVAIMMIITLMVTAIIKNYYVY